MPAAATELACIVHRNMEDRRWNSNGWGSHNSSQQWLWLEAVVSEAASRQSRCDQDYGNNPSAKDVICVPSISTLTLATGQPNIAKPHHVPGRKMLQVVSRSPLLFVLRVISLMFPGDYLIKWLLLMAPPQGFNWYFTMPILVQLEKSNVYLITALGSENPGLEVKFHLNLRFTQ